MRKLSANWVHKYLNSDQGKERVQKSKTSMDLFKSEQDILARLATNDETWLYICYPETKDKSNEWRQSGSKWPKKFRTQKSAINVVSSVFWNQNGISLVL